MNFCEGFKSLGGGNYAHKLNSLWIKLFNAGDGVDSAAAGREHRVEHENVALVEVCRQFAVIIHRLMGFRVTVHTDMTHLCGGNKTEHAVNHAEPRAKYRYKRHFSACKHLCFCGCDRRFGFYFAQRQIARRLIAHQHCDFAYKLPELL